MNERNQNTFDNDNDFIEMKLQALDTEFPVDLLERDVELWKLPDIQIYADPRITGVRTQRKHKKRKITGTLEQKFHHIPRILKSDIRRQYAVMFSNVYNSGDCSFMRSFCSIFGRDDTSLSVLKREITECHESHVGFDACTAVWYAAMNEAPDLVFKLNSNQLKLRSDGTAVVTANFTLSGTKIFTVDESELAQLQSLVSKASSQFQVISDSFSSTSSPSSSTDVAHQVDPSSSTSLLSSSSSSVSSSSSINTNEWLSGYYQDELSSLSNEFEVNPVSHELAPAVCELATILEGERKKKNIDVESLKGNLLTVPIAFKFDGQVAIHLDSDSKIHHIFLEIGKLDDK